MKRLKTFAHPSEVQLAKSLLASHGIRAELLGSLTLVVAENDLPQAQQIMTDAAKDLMLAKPVKRINHFRKGILFALGAPILIPVVFNYLSLYHAWKYWENSRQDAMDMLKVVLIVALNIPTYFILKYAFTLMGDLTSMIGLPDEGVEL